MGFYVIAMAIILATVAVMYFVLRSFGGGSAMGAPVITISEVLPAITNLERLDILKRTLRDRIDQIDYNSRWNEANYVPLEAEIQILEGRNTKRRIVDLQYALRRDQKTSIFVVLGDPGTGKSVAARKLARDLLAGSRRADRIPVYINLKEWRPDRQWSLNDPPVVEDVHKFVFHNLIQSLDYNSQSFLLESENFRRLLEAGYFFFIFDSFDEIPAVLDHEENSWLIASLSNCITTYALGGRNARAVITSRLFRKPKILHHHRSILEVRPFSDDRIVMAIDRAANEPARVKRVVFNERGDLGAIARNPFLLQLVIAHFNSRHVPPSSQAEMFETFFESNLTLARSAFGLKSLSNEDVYRVCEDIAGLMFDSPNVGLEITELDIKRAIQTPRLSETLQFLTQARIGRIGGASAAFSFSHRRFNEYFLVRRLISGRSLINYDAIQNDSRWRDALALYAEIADEEKARLLAIHAWSFASKLNGITLGGSPSEFIEARHALRFLIEAFRTRAGLLEDWHSDLKALIENKVDEPADYIEKKTVVEALGLLPVSMSRDLVLRTLHQYPGWISEHAAAAVRYFPKIDKDLASAIVQFCVNRPGLQGVWESRKQEPIFAISDAFRNVVRSLREYRWGFYKNAAALILILIVGMINRDEQLAEAVLYVLFLAFVGAIGLAPAIFILLDGHRPRDIDRSRRLSNPSMLFLFRSLDRISNWTKIEIRSFVFTSVPTISFLVLFLISIFYLLTWVGEEGEDPFYKWGLIGSRPQFSIEVAMIMLIGAIGLVSISSGFWSKVIEVVRGDRNDAVRLIVIISGAFLCFGIFSWIVAWLVKMIGHALYSLVEPYWGAIEKVIAWLPFVAGAIIFLPPAVKMFFWLKSMLVDYMCFKAISKSFSPQRVDIAQNYNRLTTAVVKNWYVDWLEVKSIDHLEELQRPSNIWPEGKRPQAERDIVSLRLAQLDARWLGLD